MLCCYEVPGYGGASTSAYRLFNKMRRDGIDVHFVNLIQRESRAFFESAFGDRLENPACLPHVHNVMVDDWQSQPQPELTRGGADIAPDVRVGIGHLATLALKLSCSPRSLVFFTAGCNLAQLMIFDGWAADVTNLMTLSDLSNKAPRKGFTAERQAVAAAYLVIANSSQTRDLYLSFYKDAECKIYDRPIWSAQWAYEAALSYRHLAKPFEEREIDLLFAASDWDRGEKNFWMVRKIAARFPHAQIHIVGGFSHPIPNAICDALLPNHELIRLMGNARTVVCPSILDRRPESFTRLPRWDATSSHLRIAAIGN